MFRRVGSRLLICAILSSPFFISGGIAFLDPSVPMLLRLTVLSVGLVIMSLGTYMSLSGVAPTPTLATGEKEIIMRHPSPKPVDQVSLEPRVRIHPMHQERANQETV